MHRQDKRLIPSRVATNAPPFGRCARTRSGRSARILAGLVLLATTPTAHAQQNDEIGAIWRDPTFQKQFVGGYGINAEIEPRITPEEVKVLEKIRPFMADDLPQAEATLRKLMKPDSSATLDYTLGSIRFQREDLAGALESYQRAVTKFPSFRRAWRTLGFLHAQDGRYDEAIRAFTRMIELGGGDGYAYGLLAIAYGAKQDWQAAEMAYRQALLLQPGETKWRYGLTRCAFKQEKFEDAAALLDALITNEPDKGDFWLLQANTYLGMKQPLKAAGNLEMMDFIGQSTVDSLHTLGDIYVTENLMDLAASAYARAVDVDESQPIARPLRSAELLAARGASAQARQLSAHIRAAWTDTMDDADRRKLLKLEARLSMADGGGDEQAAKVLEEIVALDPLDGEALLLLGQHHARNGRPDRAIFWYERAESIESSEVMARVRHAQILVGMGRYMEAVPLLRRAQEIKPRDDIARYLEQVERIAKSRR